MDRAPTNHRIVRDYSEFAAFVPWVTTVLRILPPSDLSLKKREDGTTLVTSADGVYETIFNADGTLQEWKTSKDGVTGAVRFDQLQLNAPIAADAFKWQVPENAKQVAPDDAKVEFKFSVNF